MTESFYINLLQTAQLISETDQFSQVNFAYSGGKMAETIHIKIVPVAGKTPEIGDLIMIGCFEPGNDKNIITITNRS